MPEPVYVAGAGMTRFGKFPDTPFEDFGVRAIRAALKDASAAITQVEALFLGTVYGGMVAGQRVLAQVGATGIPVVNIENACSSGAAAIRDAWIAVRAGLYDVVVAAGVEKMTDRVSGGILVDKSDLDTALGMVMAANHGMSARRYMSDYGATREQIAAVAVKNHTHSMHNPYAQYQRPISLNEVLSARLIADPLGLYDCSPISDGGAAVVICSAAGLARLGLSESAPRILGVGLVSGTHNDGVRSINDEGISRRGGVAAWELSGIDPTDIDFVEMHDCFSIAEIVRMEGLGLIPRGEGAKWTQDGLTSLGGRLPVNPSGGLLSCGHPIGATGARQACELTWQLRGQAHGRQVDGARTALAYCKGGTVSGTDGASVSTLVMQA
ncbi:thiolase family protein [Sciscionella sediminilitoris]|uniref:thiolase family protein n=1 Tax=Sciscionella sediminilitoris TaxID=1445613 RepID=UPI0003A7977B|nr:thiolase family protein [Sciscionella sp. SE31]